MTEFHQTIFEKLAQTAFRMLVCGLAQITVLVFTPSSAQAQTLIDFENLSTPVKVFGQYSNVGISFNGPRAMKYTPRLTRSGKTGIELCFAAEFCTRPLVMKIAPRMRGVSLWVGSSIPRQQRAVVVMRAFDVAGVLVGETTADLGPSAEPIFTSRQLKIERAVRDIRRVTLGYAPGPDGPMVHNGLLVDDIELIPKDGASLRLIKMEIVQATQTFDDSVPLVAGKPTVVRAFIAVPGQPGTAGTAVSVTGKLIARRSDDAPMGPISVTGQLDLLSSLNQARLQANGALMFRIPEEWTTAGAIRFELSEVSVAGGAALACTDCIKAAIFRPTRPLNLVLAPYIYNQASPPEVPELLLTPMGSLQWLNNVYPLRGDFPSDDSGVRILSYLPLDQTNYKLPDEGAKFLNDLQSRWLLLRSANWLNWPDFNLLATVASNYGGRAVLDGKVSFAVTSWQSLGPINQTKFQVIGSVWAHEVGHNFGRKHASSSHGEGGSDPDFPVPHGGIGDPGVIAAVAQ